MFGDRLAQFFQTNVHKIKMAWNITMQIFIWMGTSYDQIWLYWGWMSIFEQTYWTAMTSWCLYWKLSKIINGIQQTFPLNKIYIILLKNTRVVACLLYLLSGLFLLYAMMLHIFNIEPECLQHLKVLFLYLYATYNASSNVLSNFKQYTNKFWILTLWQLVCIYQPIIWQMWCHHSSLAIFQIQVHGISFILLFLLLIYSLEK